MYHDAGTSIRHGLYRIFFFSAKRFLNLGCGLFAGASNMRLNTGAFSLGPKCFLFLEEWGDWGGLGASISSRNGLGTECITPYVIQP